MDVKLLQDIAEAVKAISTPKTSAYDTPAKVTRVEDGVAWVHIDGGVDETPVKLTIAAQPGDTVQVRVGGGRAWLTGNGTAPPTDDRVANAAQKTATEAQETANTAVQDAETAHLAAESAQHSADVAAEAADDAQKSADNANQYASRALGGLSTVQSVVETLNWITAHGTMTLTTDTELDPTHVYFVVDASGDYVVGGTHYSIVSEPSAADLSTYYVLSIDESLQNYVGTHLALTSEGLWILPATSGYKVLIATGSGPQYTAAGTYIINASGDAVAKFGANVIVGKPNSENITIESGEIKLNALNGSNAIAIGFLPFYKDGQPVAYGTVVTGGNKTSYVNFNPTTDDASTPTGTLYLSSLMDYFNFQTAAGSNLNLSVAGGFNFTTPNIKRLMFDEEHGLRVDLDVELDINTSAAIGTTDAKLSAAITALGWGSEVYV